MKSLFPELDEADLQGAIDDADNQVQELIGQLQTLCEETGLSYEEVEDRLGQIEFDDTWDISQ